MRTELRNLNQFSDFCYLRDHEVAYEEAGGQLYQDFVQAMGVSYAFHGNYEKATYYYDYLWPKLRGSEGAFVPPDIGNQKDWEASMQNYEAISVNEFLRNHAEEYSLIMFNEAHHSAQHRMLTRAALPMLKAAGFTYLALEALRNPPSDTPSFSGRDYPLRTDGYYVQEPQFGNLIREALALGFTLVPYECTRLQWETMPQGNTSMNFRDSCQAQNIYQQTFGVDPQAKVVVHAGLGHIDEEGGPVSKPMGAYLKALAQTDPLTLDQTRLRETPHQAFEEHPYRWVLSSFEIEQPSVLQKKDGTLYASWMEGLVDAWVVFPPSQSLHGRPDWLFREGVTMVEVPQDMVEMYEDCLVRAIPFSEPDQAIPVDQHLIEPGAVLALTKGKLKLQVIHSSEQKISEQILVVE